MRISKNWLFWIIKKRKVEEVNTIIIVIITVKLTMPLLPQVLMPVSVRRHPPKDLIELGNILGESHYKMYYNLGVARLSGNPN